MDALSRRIDEADEPESFGFRFERGGTTVLECFAANRSFDIDVDVRSETTTAAVEHGDQPIAIVRDETVLLSKRLFEDPPFTTGWLAGAALDPPVAALRRALGDDLVGYLFTPDAPSSGAALALAALEAADSVAELGPPVVDGADAHEYRIVLDASRYTEAATDPSSSSTERTDSVELPPRIDIAIDARTGTVLRITVRPQRADGSLGPPEGGWTLQYHAATSAPSPPAVSDRTDLVDIDESTLVAVAPDCQIGGENASVTASRTTEVTSNISASSTTVPSMTTSDSGRSPSTSQPTPASPGGTDDGGSAGTVVFAVVVSTIAIGGGALYRTRRRRSGPESVTPPRAGSGSAPKA